MAIAVVASTSAASVNANDVTTSALNTSGANLIVVSGCSFDPAFPATLTDSKSNTWTRRTVYANSIATVLYYCASPTVGAGHTFTLATTGGNIYPTIGVVAASGAHTVPYESESGLAAGTSGASIQPGSVTPAENGCLLVSSVTSQAGTSFAIDSGFSHATQDPLGGNLGGGIGWFIQGTAGAINPTWSWTTSSNRSTSIAVFKPGPSGGYNAAISLLLLGV